MFLHKDLYRKAFIDPVLERGMQNLTIISGFGYPSMAYQHLTDLEKEDINLKLAVGMGVQKPDKMGFTRIENTFEGRFSCFVLPSGFKTHSKIYQWDNDQGQIETFIGSANYSRTALFDRYQQNEVLYKVRDSSVVSIKAYISELYNNTIPISESVVEETDPRILDNETIDTNLELPNGGCIDLPPRNGLPGVRQSLLDRSGSLPERSGLNWGNRPELNRQPSEAYIKVSATLQRKNFLPHTKGEHFLMQDMHDENFIFIAATAGGGSFINADGTKGPKQIESHEDNTIIGKFFRRKLNLNEDSIVKKEDLLRYGKTYIDIYKINDETYLIDF